MRRGCGQRAREKEGREQRSAEHLEVQWENREHRKNRSQLIRKQEGERAREKEREAGVRECVPLSAVRGPRRYRQKGRRTGARSPSGRSASVFGFGVSVALLPLL